MTDTPIAKTERERRDYQLKKLENDLQVAKKHGWIYVAITLEQAEAALFKIADLEKADPLAQELAAALKSIKALEPEPIGETGFALGPKALLGQAKRIAHRALTIYQEKKNERRKP